MVKFGLSIAPSGSGASRDPGMTLADEATQFKYYKVVLLDLQIPAITGVAPNDYASVTVNYDHRLGYKPSFLSYLKGRNGRWGLPYRGGQSVGAGADPNFPYSVFDEYCDPISYYSTVQIYSTTAVPAHTVTIRLALLYDELAVD